ncbi:MAG: hypothetical protein DI539_18200 [Flavobacterium psychrophilum]|nr:MAG: hypothetical protein DI539_18200 [Flavobacterium psychrophilum]
MKKTLFLSLIFLLSIKSNAQEKIQITTNNPNESKLKLDEFYFTHQLFSEAFYMTRMNKELSVDEMYNILKSIHNKVDIDNPVHIEIKRPSKNNAQYEFIVLESPKAKVLVMKTSYDAENENFTKEISDSTFMRFYIIDGDRLIHNSDIYSREAEEKAKKEEVYTLIGFYIFDDRKDNNDKIKPLIDNIIADPKSTKLDILYTKLYLGEYYLMNSDIVSAEKEVKSLKDFFNRNKGKDLPENYALLPNMAETELLLVKKLKGLN